MTVSTTWQEGFTYSYNGDGQIYVRTDNAYAKIADSTHVSITGVINLAYSGTLYASEGTNYAAKSVSFSYNGET